MPTYHIKFYNEFRNIVEDAIRDKAPGEKVSVPGTFGEPDESRKNMTINHKPWVKFL